jgi:ABC-2 type transport system permease protein
MNSQLPARSQLTAIAYLRWRMFVNSLRTKRGKMELASRIFFAFLFAMGAFGGFVGAIAASWYLVSQDKAEFLAIPLWLIFFWWQVFPIMSTAFTSNPDSSELLRFPLAYRSYFLVRLAYGFFDPACAIGSAVLLGILLGASFARLSLFPVALLALLIFAAFNVVLMQTIFAWLERWLAQRRTREILGVLFILFMLSFQLVGPLMERIQNKPHPEWGRAAEIAAQAQAVLPPGLAAAAIAKVSHGEYLAGLASLLFLAVFTLAVGSLLHLRMRAQFRGENLSEAAARPAVAQREQVRPGWDLPGFSQAAVAVFQKEMHYLARSGPMLLTLIMPIFMLIIFRMGPMNPMRQSNMFTRAPDMAFPGAAAYSLLVLTNLIYNSFGGDGGGMQFFYASPVRFSQIVLGKNLTHAAIVVANTALAWIAVAYLYGPPHLAVSIATIAGLFFATPLNFTAGNLLSIYSPRKRDFSTFGRQNISQLTALAALGVQAVIVGLGVAAFAVARVYQNLWIATVVFLVLSAISVPMYVMILHRLDSIAVERREALLAELCRA